MDTPRDELQKQTDWMIGRAIYDMENIKSNVRALRGNSAGKINKLVFDNREVMGTCKPDKPSEKLQSQLDQAVELLMKWNGIHLFEHLTLIGVSLFGLGGSGYQKMYDETDKWIKEQGLNGKDEPCENREHPKRSI